MQNQPSPPEGQNSDQTRDLAGSPATACSADPITGLTEWMFDEYGQLLHEKPYPFRRLFESGQDQTINSVPMKVLFCGKKDNIVITVVRLFKPWPDPVLPNAKAQATTPAPTNDDHGNKQ